MSPPAPRLVHPASRSGIERARDRVRARQASRASREHQRWLDEVARRLVDPLRLGKGSFLTSLVSVGMEQLSIQTVAAGSQDTQAGVVLAGAGALAAADSSLRGWVWPLIAALVSGVFALMAIVIAKPEGGPVVSKLLNRRVFLDRQGREILLSDDEAEWMLVGDIEVAVDRNARQLAIRGRLVALAILALLAGLGDLVALEAAAEAGRSP